MRVTFQGVLVSLLLVLPAACTGATGTPSPSPLPSPTATGVMPTEVPASATLVASAATASTTSSSTPSSTATFDATQSAAMTLEAIRVAVTASGVPEGSTEFDAQVAATQCLLIPPATSTPLPWQLEPQMPFQVSGNCLGNDLPGQAARIWQRGVWTEADDFLFANPADLELARHRYLDYLGLISLQAGAPGDAFASELAKYMNSTAMLPAPESCLANEINDGLTTLLETGQYVRLTFTQPLQWDEDYHLFISAGVVELALPWSTLSVRQELIAADTGTTLKVETLSRLAGAALMTWNNGEWYVTDDTGGYYCNNLLQFVE